jgi:hypothetical protein
VFFYAVGFKAEEGISAQHVYFVSIAARTFNRVNTAELPVGANWGGETEVMSRLLSHVLVEHGSQWNEIPAASIPFNFFTWQGAIDLRCTRSGRRWSRFDSRCGRRAWAARSTSWR